MADPDYLALFGGDQPAAQNQAQILADAIRARRAGGTLAQMYGAMSGNKGMQGFGNEQEGAADKLEQGLIGAAQHRAGQELQARHLDVQEKQLEAMMGYRNGQLGLRQQGLDLQREKAGQAHYAINPNTGERYNTKGSLLPGATAASNPAAAPAPAASVPGAGPAPHAMAGKMLDKMLQSLGADFDPSGGRAGEFGKNYARTQAANRILALAQTPEGKPANLTPQQMTEVASSLGSLISAGGQPSERITQEMTPFTAGRKWADFMQYITNELHGTNQQAFVQQAIDTAKREQGVAQQALDLARQQRAMKHQVVLKANPEESRKILQPFGWDLDEKGNVVMKGAAPKPGASGPKRIKVDAEGNIIGG